MHGSIIVIFKPERIQSPTLFRWATTLAALSILLPPVLTFFFNVTVSTGGGGRNADDISALVMMLGSTSGPVLLGLSVLAAFASLRPRPAPYVSKPQVPEKHPLD